jgi:hypothetical protein
MVAPMPTIRDIDLALSRVEDAETQLEELAALVLLDRIVRTVTRESVAAALATHSQSEVSRAVGVSRQAIAKRGRARKT